MPETEDYEGCSILDFNVRLDIKDREKKAWLDIRNLWFCLDIEVFSSNWIYIVMLFSELELSLIRDILLVSLSEEMHIYIYKKHCNTIYIIQKT